MAFIGSFLSDCYRLLGATNVPGSSPPEGTSGPCWVIDGFTEQLEGRRIVRSPRQQPHRLGPVAREHVPERAPGLVHEALLEHHAGAHAVEAEVAEVLAQLAPGGEAPARAPQERAERAHVALALAPLL